MKKLVFLILLVMLFFVPPALAQEEVFSIIENSSNYPSEDREYLLDRVGEMIADLQKNDLSADTLVLKLREGLRKKARPYNIIKSLEKKKDSLIQAHDILMEVDPYVVEDKDLLNDLAISIEYAVPSDLVRNTLKQTVIKDSDNVKKVIDSLSALIEMGASPQQAGNIINQFVQKSTKAKDLNSLTKIIERARREGIDPQQVAVKMEEALRKNNSITMVEMEIQGFIADIKQKPTIRSGQGIVVTSPGITSSGVPGSEGGTPLSDSSATSTPSSTSSSTPSSTSSSTPSSSTVPSQEGGSPLE